MAWHRKDLLALGDLTTQELELLLDTIQGAEAWGSPGAPPVPFLRDTVVAHLFYEPSTRTRTSFELAARLLGTHVVTLTPGSSSIVKGESLKDTARTLDALGAGVLVIRHPRAGAAHFVARHTKAAVINAGDGAHEHPTQALLDMATMRALRGGFTDRRIVIVGDILHSRVARSLVFALTRLGADVTLVGPSTLLPQGLSRWARMSSNLDAHLPDADVVYMLRIQRERQGGQYIPSLREYRQLFGLTQERATCLKDTALIMHPGPVNPGVEMDAAVLDDPRCAIFDQVRSGVRTRMAVLTLLAGGVPVAAAH